MEPQFKCSVCGADMPVDTSDASEGRKALLAAMTDTIANGRGFALCDDCRENNRLTPEEEEAKAFFEQAMGVMNQQGPPVPEGMKGKLTVTIDGEDEVFDLGEE